MKREAGAPVPAAFGVAAGRSLAFEAPPSRRELRRGRPAVLVFTHGGWWREGGGGDWRLLYSTVYIL